MHGTVLPPPAPTVLRRLLDDVMDGHDVLVLADAAEGRALLGEAAVTLTKQRTRALHVCADTAGGLGVSDLLTQLGGRDPDSQDDRDLQQSFQALTVLDPACDRIALLVSGAHALQPSALRYIQLACRSNAGLRLVFAGAPSVLELLDNPAFADLAARLERTPLSAAAIIALPAPTPRPSRPSPLPEKVGLPSRPSRRTGRGTLAALGMVALVLLGITIGRSTGPAPSHGTQSVASAPPPAAAQTATAIPTAAPAPIAAVAAAPDTAALAEPPPIPAPQALAAAPQPTAAPAPALLPTPEAAAVPMPLPPLAEATPPTPHPLHPAARHEPARSVAHVARPGSPRDDAWPDYYGRPVPPPQEARPPRSAPEPYYGWNQVDSPGYIGTFRTNANGVRSFTYGP